MNPIRRAIRLIGPLLGGALLLAAGVLAVRWGLGLYYHAAYPLAYTALIDSACDQKGLDPALVYAVVRTESGFDPDAQSPVGARGLMQLMPDAYDWVRMRRGEPAEGADYEDLYDPAVCVDYGTDMLRLLLAEFGSVRNTLCAYHAGWGSVKSWLADPQYAPDGRQVEQIPFADTRDYVQKVERAMEIYRRLYPDKMN